MTAVSEPFSAAPQAPEQAIEGKSPRQLFWERFRKDKAAIGGLITVLILILLAIFAPLIAKHLVGHGPNELFQTADARRVRAAQGAERGLLVRRRPIGAGRVRPRALRRPHVPARRDRRHRRRRRDRQSRSGSSPGYFRGFTDTVISRSIDIILALPLLLFAIGIVAACGTTKEGCFGGLIQPGLSLVIFIIALFSWPYIARIVRGNVLSIREKEFVEAARSLGAGNFRIMFREVLPNLIAPIIVYTTLLIPANILFEAALSFLGVGVPAEHAVVGADALGRLRDLRRRLVADALSRAVPDRDDARRSTCSATVCATPSIRGRTADSDASRTNFGGSSPSQKCGIRVTRAEPPGERACRNRTRG